MNWSPILFPFKLFLWLVVFIGAAYLLVAFNYSYSDGSRAGYIQKLSTKGWLCKTSEGELAMTTVPGVAPVLWDFTVWDEKVASQLSQSMGKRLVLHYKEYRYLPTSCFGETPYFVDRIEMQE
ncbi:MAG: hypothetical protein GDA67_08840 [Nitrospira sp. CR1.3]|nr:hypothetical protein [Nitrospira sp. CR1.3]